MKTKSEVEAARIKGVCRICGKEIYIPAPEDYPEKYYKYAGGIVCGVALNYGEEFAHNDCLITKTEEEQKTKVMREAALKSAVAG